ncbi:hypothetical protein [Chlorogloeopsis fritschii]|uniref:hypothetical protein n=1 Tax=Chlorogloeopsis fritschii TaxID=1124 RepID=UPI0023F6B443|nr:hypothetical protein [Chlorogloeopsis fritschii]
MQRNCKRSYIGTHQAEVQAEYQQVLKIAEDNRQYWEERNREHFARLAALRTARDCIGNIEASNEYRLSPFIE